MGTPSTAVSTRARLSREVTQREAGEEASKVKPGGEGGASGAIVIIAGDTRTRAPLLLLPTSTGVLGLATRLRKPPPAPPPAPSSVVSLGLMA